MCEWYVPIGKQCPDCRGQGGMQIEAGGGEWWDDCESCNGTGRVK